jgi:hypothetical protein
VSDSANPEDGVSVERYVHDVLVDRQPERLFRPGARLLQHALLGPPWGPLEAGRARCVGP